jgi:hypothetical protein
MCRQPLWEIYSIFKTWCLPCGLIKSQEIAEERRSRPSTARPPVPGKPACHLPRKSGVLVQVAQTSRRAADRLARLDIAELKESGLDDWLT